MLLWPEDTYIGYNTYQNSYEYEVEAHKLEIKILLDSVYKNGKVIVDSKKPWTEWEIEGEVIESENRYIVGLRARNLTMWMTYYESLIDATDSRKTAGWEELLKEYQNLRNTTSSGDKIYFPFPEVIYNEVLKMQPDK